MVNIWKTITIRFNQIDILDERNKILIDKIKDYLKTIRVEFFHTDEGCDAMIVFQICDDSKLIGFLKKYINCYLVELNEFDNDLMMNIEII